MIPNNNQWILATVICAVSLFGLIITDMIMVGIARSEVDSTIDCRETRIVHEGENICIKGNMAYTIKTICDGFLWKANCRVEATEQPQYSVSVSQIRVNDEAEQNE